MTTTLTGLLRLRRSLAPADISLLLAATHRVERRLYVALVDNWAPLTFKQVQERLLFVYQQAARTRPELDVRVVLPGADAEAAPGGAEVDALLGEAGDEEDLPRLNELRSSLGLSSLVFVELTQGSAAASGVVRPASADGTPASVHEDVCVGGTFDYMHVGHKLLLSLAAYSTSKRLVVGVSDTPLLKKKALREMMQPVELRMAVVEDFLRTVKPALTYELSALQDGFGPAIVDPQLQAILVSEETQKGGEMCNEKRAQKGFAPLAVVTMPLVDEGQSAADEVIGEANKVSSTDKRKAMLAKMRGGDEHFCRRSAADVPYVIGLTGGIASGKSTARRMLVEIARDADGGADGGGGGGGGGSVVDLDCDKLAHAAYEPGMEAHAQLVEAFGQGILSTDAASAGTINRKALGAIVFSDPSAMQRLNAIAWPATAKLAQAEIAKSGAQIVVMEAAVLLEAGWDAFCDEVWVINASHPMVITRLAERNGLSAAAAEERIAAQMSAEARVARSHVALSSAFGEEETRAQLARALQGARVRSRQLLEEAVPGSPASRFHQLCASVGVGAAEGRRWWGVLRDHYCDPHRHYHSMVHIAAMLGSLDVAAERGGLTNPTHTGFATFFHDAIYDPTKGDNEAKSAELWRTFAADAASSSLTPADVDTVARYIERTAKHLDGAATADLAAFLDADLAVLGRPPPAYAEYARAVRLEYAHVPSATFATKRAAVLRGFADAPRLYFGELGATLDAPARANLVAEIQRLEQRA